LSLLDTLDTGAPVTRTLGTRQRVLGMLRWYAGMATPIHGETIENSLPGEFFSYTLKEPIGVVGAIIPWNGPLGASIWKIGPALATGCPVILKPAEEAPLTSPSARRIAAGRRRAAGGREHRAGLWRDRRRGTCRPSRGRQGCIHRFAF